MHGRKARQKLLDPEVAEGLSALELGDVQGHCLKPVWGVAAGR
jgi:hypothetical protein